MARARVAAGALLAALLLAACGGGDGMPDTGPPVPAESCGQPGDEGNDIGVGRFCTRRGGQCAVNSGARLCLQDVAPDDDQWFCTRLCTMDSECGAGAVCVGEARGAGCVPAECAPPASDAGSESDASTAADDAGATPADDAAPSDDAGA